MEAICDAAIAQGLSEIAVCDHAEFTPLDECYGYLRPATYLAEIARCQRKYGQALTVRAGVEVGEPHKHPDAVAALLAGYEFDVVLGSLHFVDDLPSFSSRYFRDQTLEEGVTSYFSALADQAAAGDFDVLAHFDIICRAAYRAFGAAIADYSPYERLVRQVLRILIERGKGLEINTATTYRRMGDLASTLQVLRWYREMGGGIITLGSDAHCPRDVGAGCDAALDVARAAGFDWLATYEGRQVRRVRI